MIKVVLISGHLDRSLTYILAIIVCSSSLPYSRTLHISFVRRYDRYPIISVRVRPSTNSAIITNNASVPRCSDIMIRVRIITKRRYVANYTRIHRVFLIGSRAGVNTKSSDDCRVACSGTTLHSNATPKVSNLIQVATPHHCQNTWHSGQWRTSIYPLVVCRLLTKFSRLIILHT